MKLVCLYFGLVLGPDLTLTQLNPEFIPGTRDTVTGVSFVVNNRS